MSAYTQFGYPYSAPAPQLLVPGQTSSAGGATTSCCETGRVVATDPVTGAAICSCQYDSSRLSALNSYPRLSTGSTLHYSAAYAGGDPQSPYPSIGVDSGYFGSLGGAYGLKETGAADMGVYGGITSTPGYGYNPYDPSLYGYAAPYDLAARRKNATRESTGTLKAWLNEHKKNPYPTKGEKIMLAIITKMTLTQVSTWFANARRRLKKENKMTWEVKNKTESDEEADASAEDKDKEDKDEPDSEKDSSLGHSRKEAFSPDTSSEVKAEALSPSSQWKDKASLLDCGDALKPKIWSLADTAVCKTPPAGAAWSGETRFPCGDASGTTFPLPPTIGPGQIPRFSHLSQARSAHQSQSLARTQPQTSPSSSSYHQGGSGENSFSSNSGPGYAAIAGAYVEASADTPPQTPPHSKSSIGKASAVHGYNGVYAGVHPPAERRNEAYTTQDMYRQRQYRHMADMHPEVGGHHEAELNHPAVPSHLATDMNGYTTAYKSGSTGAVRPPEYNSHV